MAGAVDGNGVYIYAETDSASPFSTLLNLAQNAISTKIGSLVSQINAITTARDAAWTTYAPTLTASTTNPTGWNLTGYYKQTGKTVVAWIIATAGSSFTPGSGVYYLTLPTAVNGMNGAHGGGSGFEYINGYGQYSLTVQLTGGNQFRLIGASGVMTNAYPHTFAAGDYFSATITYEAP